MSKPAWFFGALLGMLALLLSVHIGLLGYGVHRCSTYSERLQLRLDRLAPGTPEAAALRKDIEIKATRCQGLADHYDTASERYTGTILALLGGAGLSAGAGAVRQGPKP